MLVLVAELAYLAGTLLTGTYVLLSTAQCLSQVLTRGPLIPASLSSSAHLSILTAALLVPLCVALSNQWYYYRGTRIHRCGLAPVYPHKDPILGTDLFRIMLRAIKESRVLAVWDDNLARCGKTHWENATGKWYVLTSEADNIKAVLATQFDTFPILSVRKKFAELVLGPRSIFAVNGAEWHQSRSMIRPTFVRNQIADLQCTDRHLDNFLAKLPRDGSTFDIDQLLYAFTMDAATDFMFGTSTNTLTSPTQEAVEFVEAFEYANFVSASRGRLGWLTYFIPDKKFDDSVKLCHLFVARHVAKSLAHDSLKERSYVFLNELVKSGASQELISNQLLSMILGGRDTSASVLSSLFFILARRPDVVDKIRAEVVQFDGRKPSWEDLKALKYVNNVLRETLRLWAPVSSNVRTASKDTLLPRGGGPDGQSPIFIPKGTDVRYSFHALHRSKQIYGEDADEFRPDRWDHFRPSWDYLPFSGGPRICIGQQFALTQMAYLLTRVFQQFDGVEARSEEPMKHRLLSTMKLVGGCWIALRPVEGYHEKS